MRENLGSTLQRTDIRSSIGPFNIFNLFRVFYPSFVIDALIQLYTEYNFVFKALLERNREWATDYQYCDPVNFGVQIDMKGLKEKTIAHLSYNDIVDFIRGNVFEIENSLAMYGMLSELSPGFRENFRDTLDTLRRRYGFPIALLAVTEEKYQAMKASEFGKQADQVLTDDEVFEISGFDFFWSPSDFLRHLEENGGECKALINVRPSDPISKQKNPKFPVYHPLLSDPKTRRIIKAHSITPNIDDPVWPIGDPRRINDSKMYMPEMGMGILIRDETDIFSPELIRHLFRGHSYSSFNGPRLNDGFLQSDYLKRMKVNLDLVVSGETKFRGKPAQGTYGCYGHTSGSLSDNKFRGEFRKGLRERGPYILQVEHIPSTVWNTFDGVQYDFIDRMFLGMVNGAPRLLSGFRDFLPKISVEAQKGRIHGNGQAVWAVG